MPFSFSFFAEESRQLPVLEQLGGSGVQGLASPLSSSSSWERALFSRSWMLKLVGHHNCILGGWEAMMSWRLPCVQEKWGGRKRGGQSPSVCSLFPGSGLWVSVTQLLFPAALLIQGLTAENRSVIPAFVSASHAVISCGFGKSRLFHPQLDTSF